MEGGREGVFWVKKNLKKDLVNFLLFICFIVIFSLVIFSFFLEGGCWDVNLVTRF